MDPTTAALVGTGAGTLLGGGITFLTRAWQDRMAFRREVRLADRVYLRELYSRALQEITEMAKALRREPQYFDANALNELRPRMAKAGGEIGISGNAEVAKAWDDFSQTVLRFGSAVSRATPEERSAFLTEVGPQRQELGGAMRRHLESLAGSG